MEYKPKNPEARLAFRLLWVLLIVLVIVLAIVLAIALSLDLPLLDFMKQLLPSIVWNFELVKSLPDNCFPSSPPNNANVIEVESCSAIIRNFGLMVGIGLSFMIAVFGLFLALWGRITQMQQWKTEEKRWKTEEKKLDLENKQWELQRRQLEIQDKKEELRQREKLQERFEKASDMLSDNAELTRASACRSLADLGIADESMKVRCVHLLFAFINNPYLESNYIDKNFDELFPANKPLRLDIQQAIDSFSAIYEHYEESGVDYEEIKLPTYFWRNEHKGRICLIATNLIGKNLKEINLNGANLRKTKFAWSNLEGANLSFANLERGDLQHAILVGANLSGANLRRVIFFNADLRKADLFHADLEEAFLDVKNLEGASFFDTKLNGAYISGLDMRKAVNLTKEQILSTKWGYGQIKESSGPPQLPEDLMQDEDIKKWLETPTYDERKPKDSQ